MSLYRVDDKELKAVATTTFQEQGLQERRDLQQLIINQPSALGSDLFIIAEEFENWSKSARRIDLLAIDGDGTLTVIELKRNEDPGPMDLQALRYAAMVANITLEQLTDVHQAFGEAHGLDGDASSRLGDFLNEQEIGHDDLQTAKPRILLVAPEFPTELTTSVLWLNDVGLDIRCVRLLLYRSDGNLFVDASQVIPLPEADDYLVRAREKAEEVETVTRQRRALTSTVLVQHKVIQGGERIMLYPANLYEPGEFDASDHKWQASFGPNPLVRRNVEWNGDSYSLTKLSEHLRDTHSVPLPEGTLSAYWFWCLVDRPETSLAALADSLYAGSTTQQRG